LEDGVFIFKKLTEKIEFRTIQLLVSEFNNLPLVYEDFESTTESLFNSTMALLNNLPALNKATKTRTAQSSNNTNTKLSLQSIRDIQREIRKNPVDH
jgi:hypothetical protein